MKIIFFGGADEVGASSALLEISGKHILVDCGFRPSPCAAPGRIMCSWTAYTACGLPRLSAWIASRRWWNKPSRKLTRYRLSAK
jgi:hypothetical protein